MFSQLPDSAGGLGGYEILKVHDADPLLGVEVKFVDVAACQQFLKSYSSGALHQSLSQHACRLFALPQELTVETQLKASTHILDRCLDDLDLCLQQIHQSQVYWTFPCQFILLHPDIVLTLTNFCLHQPVGSNNFCMLLLFDIMLQSPFSQ